MAEFVLNREKSVNALLYVCTKLGGAWDMYSLLKIIYFAECKHLVEFGRPITGDRMIAMKYGPVPSFSYDEIKLGSIDTKYFSSEDDVIVAQSSPDMDYLSKSEVSCLDWSIEENAHLGFGELKTKSHTPIYEQTKRDKGINSVISWIDIAKEAQVSNEMLKYISEKIEFSGAWK